ncbi:MAG: prepilin-type N-terminal cleavage/methylation domain-containing protein [Candidatus Omnitrophota bacterium]
MRKSFTLVEIMIVVAIIALLAAVAIPGLIRSRTTANEANAIRAVKSIATSCEVFRASQSAPTYPTNLDSLTNATPPYVASLGTGDPVVKAGYNYTLSGSTDTFFIIANPTISGSTGYRSFCVNETGDLYSQNSPMSAGCSGSILQ